MRIAVVGTGAVGGYYGGVLAKAGEDVPTCDLVLVALKLRWNSCTRNLREWM